LSRSGKTSIQPTVAIVIKYATSFSVALYFVDIYFLEQDNTF